MKWTKENVRKGYPYPMAITTGTACFAWYKIMYSDFSKIDALVLFGSIALAAILRFGLVRIVKTSIFLAVVGSFFSIKAQAQTKYVMGFGAGSYQQPIGFYTYDGKSYPAQTGAPGYFHSSHEWIVTDLNGGKLVHGDQVTLLNKVTNQYLMVQKAGAQGVPEYSYTNFSKTPFVFTIGKGDVTKKGPRILPADTVTFRFNLGTAHHYLTSVRTEDTTKEVCHFNADLNKPRTECWDEVIPGREVLLTTRYATRSDVKSHSVGFRAGYFVRTHDLIHGRNLYSKSCYKNGNEFDACERMMLVADFSWADLDRTKTFIDVMNASSSAATAGAATGAIIGLAIPGVGSVTGAAIAGGVFATAGAAVGLAATWNEQEAAKLKADIDAKRAGYEREWAKAYEAERSNPDFVGPVRPEKPVLDIR